MKSIISIKVLLILVLPLQLFAFSGWDRNNDPRIMDLNYERSFEKLPQKGKLTKTPWSDDYWPTYKGGITYRWAENVAKDESRWSYNLTPMNQLTRSEIRTLSPAEKYDLYLGNKDYSLTNYERKRTQILRTVNSSDLFDPNYKIPTWEGLCHAWAPATYQYENPEPVTLKNPNGVEIPFWSSDIKALLTMHGHLNNSTNNRFLGSRCYLDFKELEEKYKKGEITKKEFLEKINSASCEDVNAGAFHVTLTNQIALRNKSFVIDVTRDAEVWNQPVEAFESQILKETRGASAGAANGTVKEITVLTYLRYIGEVAPYWKNIIDKRAFKVLKYQYTLELNKNGDIIGGKWISHDRPDFLWDETVPKFQGFFKGLEKIYERSIAYTKPKMWDESKDKILKLGKEEVTKKTFIDALENEVRVSKLKDGWRKEYLKRQFVIEAAKKAMETKIRKVARKKYLKNKMRSAGSVNFLKTKFIDETKKEVVKTKVKKILKKEALKRDFIKKIKSQIILNKMKNKVGKVGHATGFISEIKEVMKERQIMNQNFVKAVLSGDLKTAKKLLKEGADVNGLEAGLQKEELIKNVIKNGDNKMLRILLSRDATIETVMTYAFGFDNQAVQRTLISRGGDINYVDETGMTPLLMAAKIANLDAVKLLLAEEKISISLNNQDNEGKNALIWAIIGSGNAPDSNRLLVIQEIINGKIDMNAKDKAGLSALGYAYKWPYRSLGLRRMIRKAGGEKSGEL